MAEDIYQVAPSPNKTIGCQDLLKDGACIDGGWLRRQSLRNKFKIFSWPQVYVVISGGCVYCYRNEMAKKPVTTFSLYGYNQVLRAGMVSEKEALWSFKLVHVNPSYRSYLFSASSEKEMLSWMKLFKQEMLKANGKMSRTQGDGWSSDTAMYQDANSFPSGGSIKSADYSAVEENIYEDSSLWAPPVQDVNKKEEDASDDEMDILVISRPDLQERPPLPPPVPDRPPKHSLGAQAMQMSDAVVAQLKQKTVEQDTSYTTPQSHERLQGATSATVKTEEKTTEDSSSKPSSLRKRGDPDGSSRKRQDQETKDFWSSIFFYGGKEQASEIIRQLPEDGVFLVRVNEDKSKVLHVWAKEQARKFQIFELDNKVTLKKTSDDKFKRVEDLVYFYYSNPLPNLDVCLSECYLYHPDFQNIQLS